MKNPVTNSGRDRKLTHDQTLPTELFLEAKYEISREIRELKEAKWNLDKHLATTMNVFLKKINDLLRAFNAIKENLSPETLVQLMTAYRELEAFVEQLPFLLKMIIASKSVQRQIGEDCGVDIAAAMNKLKISKHAEGNVSANQAISLLNRFANLKRNKPVECSEKEAFMFRYLLGCEHLLNANVSNPAYKEDVVLGKRQGGNFVGFLSRFAKRKDSMKFFKRLETFKSSNDNELNERELIIATVHGLEILATFIASLSERKLLCRLFKKPFEIEDEVNQLKLHIGEKLARKETLNGKPIKSYAEADLFRPTCKE